MILGGVRGTETEAPGDFGAGGREAGALHEIGNQLQYLGLAGGQIVHGKPPVL